MSKSENYLKGIEYEMDIGYAQYKDRKSDMILKYWCGDEIVVDLNLPREEHHVWSEFENKLSKIYYQGEFE